MENKAIGKSELAKLYFPHSKEKTAIKQLMRWINGNTELISALQATGYNTHNKYFTPRQRDLIFEYLCDP